MAVVELSRRVEGNQDIVTDVLWIGIRGQTVRQGPESIAIGKRNLPRARRQKMLARHDGEGLDKAGSSKICDGCNLFGEQLSTVGKANFRLGIDVIGNTHPSSQSRTGIRRATQARAE